MGQFFKPKIKEENSHIYNVNLLSLVSLTYLCANIKPGTNSLSVLETSTVLNQVLICVLFRCN